MSEGPPALRRCVIAGGHGAVGSLFASILTIAGAEVWIIDPAPAAGPAGHPPVPAERVLRADITSPHNAARRALASADLVLLAVPEAAALAALPHLARTVRVDALVADTLSVKSRIAGLLSQGTPPAQAVGLNPMAAPSLGLSGRPVAAVVYRDGPRAEALLRLVEAHGGKVVRVSAERHDQLTAATQALTHACVLAFGVALAELGVGIDELTDLATPPHATMLALLARIASGSPEVCWDIQSGNPRAPASRDALARAVRRLGECCTDQAAFTAAMSGTARLLGQRLPDYRALCAQLFDAMPTDRGPAPGGAETAGQVPLRGR